MQRVVVERGVAEQPDGFAADREFRAVDRVAGFQVEGLNAKPPIVTRPATGQVSAR